MKKKLILIQPQKYNELFSTYHNSKKSKKFLPTIPSNLQKEFEITAYTTKTNLLTQKNFNRESFSSNKNHNIFKRNINFLNSLMTHQYSQDNFKNNHEFLPFPSLTQQYKKTDEKFKNKKKFENKKSNFNIIYLNLSNKNNKENEEYSVEQIEKNEFVNKKIEEINISKKQKIKEIFNKNEKIKIKNDLSMINKIPIVIINIFAEDIYNNMKNQKNQIKIDSNNISKSLNSKNNLDSKKNLLDFDNINKTIYKNNTFFQYVLDNVRHKVELINESNKSITMLYVMNLINKEISDLKKNVEDMLLENNYQNTSNNISKTSNYDFTPSNTFRFKTNTSKFKHNESNYNNKSGVLGNLIKNNIYSKKNDGSKKIFFENILNNKNREKYIFQNKEIIFSIHQNEAKGKATFRNIKKINIPKALKNINNLNLKIKEKESGIYTDIKNDKEKFLTSRYYNKTSPNQIRGKYKYFNKIKEEKKISHSFSEIFLKKNYPKASDFINEISNSIEKKYLLEKGKETIKINKDSTTQTNLQIKNLKGSKNKKKRHKYSKQHIHNNSMSKENYNDNNNGKGFRKYKNKNDDDDEEEEEDEENDYEYIKEQNIITPKKSKELFQAFSDNQEKKIKIKNKKMKNNYENIVLNMESIKQEESKLTLTPKKYELLDQKFKIDPSSSLTDSQQFSKNNEPNLIYFDKNKKRNQIISENQVDINKRKRKNKKKKNKGKRNLDLTSIKSSKTFENDIYGKSINKNILNSNDENIIIKENDKIKKKKRKKKKNIEMLINLINNNPNIENKEEIIKKFINSKNETGKYLNGEEESEEEYYGEEMEEEEDDEESFEEEDEEEAKDGTLNNKLEKDPNKKLIKKKRKKKKASQMKEKDFSENQKLILSYNNINNSDKKTKENKKNDKEIVKINDDNDNLSMNLTNTKPKDSFIKNNRSSLNNQTLNNKSKKGKKHISVFKGNKNFIKERRSLKDRNIEENPEYKELIKEMEKYNVTNKNDLYNAKHLKEDKKEKQVKGGINQKTNDNSFFTIDDNLDDIIKKNAPPSNINLKNYQKQEELKIVNEVMELDSLTEQEKNYVLSEMLNLRNIISKAKIIDKEIKIQINSKRVALYRIVNKFFLDMILNDIKKESVEISKYTKKLKKLEKFQNFGIFTYKNLSVLENKYVFPYLEKYERNKREKEEREKKKLRKKLALEEHENYKKMMEKKKRAQLIYDNSYLFKKEKQKEYKLRKEVEDLLNKEYEEFENLQNPRRSQKLVSRITKRKKRDKKRKSSKGIYINSKLRKLQNQEQSDIEEENSKQLKELEEEKKEELKEKKLKEFFEKIRKLKNGEFKDFDEELNQLINDIMNRDVVSKNKENRMNSFIQNFEYNRQKNKSSPHCKGFNFVSPIRFISDIQK